MNPLSGILAKNLIEIRTTVGLTQSQLAKGAKVSLRAIQNIEYQRAWPGLKMLDAVSKVLRVPVTSLLSFDNPKPFAIPSAAQYSLRLLLKQIEQTRDGLKTLEIQLSQLEKTAKSLCKLSEK